MAERKTERPCIIQLRILLKQDTYKNIIDENGVVATPKSEIYQLLSMALNKSLSPKNIYTILKENRYKIHTDLLNFHNIIYKPVTKYNPIFDESYSDDDSNQFSIDITDIWHDIEAENVDYNCKERVRTIGILKRRAWTDMLFEKIHGVTKLVCPLSFKKSQTSTSGYAVTVNAKCPDCNAEFQGIIANTPKSNDLVKMECFLVNYNPSVPHGKRQLKGEKN